MEYTSAARRFQFETLLLPPKQKPVRFRMANLEDAVVDGCKATFASGFISGVQAACGTALLQTMGGAIGVSVIGATAPAGIVVAAGLGVTGVCFGVASLSVSSIRSAVRGY